MVTHLNDFIENEVKYGNAEESHKERVISTAKATVELLQRMANPHDYAILKRNAVDERYPRYKYLVTDFIDGSTSYSGRFVSQGDGWVGMESGTNPRSGYFEFVNSLFQLADSPNQVKTDELLDELARYNDDVELAYRQAEEDSDRDFERLHELLKENLYSWWD